VEGERKATKEAAHFNTKEARCKKRKISPPPFLKAREAKVKCKGRQEKKKRQFDHLFPGGEIAKRHIKGHQFAAEILKRKRTNLCSVKDFYKDHHERELKMRRKGAQTAAYAGKERAEGSVRNEA